MSLTRKFKENSTTGTLLRLGWFLCLYLSGRYLLLLIEGTNLMANLHQPLLWTINEISTRFLGLFYPTLASSHEYIVTIDGRAAIQLFPGCSGLQPILRISFILLLYPLPWKMKAWLFPLSWFILIIAATIHFILLIPIAFHWPEYYGISHNWLTRFLFYGFYFLTWLLWEKAGYPKNTNRTG